MPKIRSLDFYIEKTKVPATLYYFDASNNSHYDGGRFFVSLPPQYYMQGSEDIQKRSMRRGVDHHGCAGNTESEAIENAKKYLEWWKEENGRKEYYLLIDVNDYTRKTDYFGRRDEDAEEDRQQAMVDFKFLYAYKSVVNGEETWYTYDPTDPDRAPSKQYSVTDFTVIPNKGDVAERCLSLVQMLHTVNRRILDLFKDAETAHKTLSNIEPTLKLLQSPLQ